MARGSSSPTTKVRVEHKVLFALLIIPIIIALVWFLFTSPQKVKLDTAQKEQQQSDTALAVSNARLNSLRSGKGAQGPELYTKSQALDTLLPKDTPTASIAFAGEFESTANASGLQLLDLKPSADAPITLGNAIAHSYTGTVSGSREDVLTFFAKVSSYPQLITVPNLSLLFPVQTSDGRVPDPIPVPTSAKKISTTDSVAVFTVLAWYTSEPALPNQGPNTTPVKP